MGLNAAPNGPNLNPNAAVIWQGPVWFEDNHGGVGSDQPRGGRQSVVVRGSTMVDDPIVESTNYYHAIGSYRRPVTYDWASLKRVRVQAQIQIHGPRSRFGSNLFSASVAARGVSSTKGTGGIGEIALSSDGYVFGYSGDDNTPTFQTMKPVDLDESHTLAIAVDFTTKTYQFFLDGDPLGHPFPFPVDADQPTLARGALITYLGGNADPHGNGSNPYLAVYDNFSITAY